MVTLYHFFLLALGCERVFEVYLSRKNLASVQSRGGFVLREPLYLWIVALHLAFFASCVLEVAWMERPFPGLLGLIAFFAAIAAQGLRYWAVGSLGDRWNVRLVVVPGEPPVRSGPYRWFRHPNYLAVGVEILAVPLIHGAYATAIFFSLANGLILFLRVPVEEAALTAAACAKYKDRRIFAARPLPGEETTLQP